MASGNNNAHIIRKVATRYQTSTFETVADQLIQRIGGDPLTVAAAARDLLSLSGVNLSDESFWNFLPEGVEATDALHEITNGLLLTLDHDPSSVKTVVSHLLSKVGYTDQSKGVLES